MEGSMGFVMGRARLEVEVGHEKFELKSRRDDGKNKLVDADSVYLLAKELAYDVIHNNTHRLARALERVPGIDIVAFAAALKSWNPDVDKKLCNAKFGNTEKRLGYCVLRKSEAEKKIYREELRGFWEVTEPHKKKHKNSNAGFWDYLKWISYREKEQKEYQDRKKHWEVFERLLAGRYTHENHGLSMAYDDASKASHWPVSGVYKGVDNSVPVAGNMTKALTPKEQSGVAKLLSQVVEGAEVVVLKAISSTSVMINACYDMFSEGIGIVP